MPLKARVPAGPYARHGLSNPIKYTDPSGHSVDCGIGDAYCGAGKLDVQRRADDLYRYLSKQRVTMEELNDYQRAVFAEARGYGVLDDLGRGLVEQKLTEIRAGGFVDAQATVLGNSFHPNLTFEIALNTYSGELGLALTVNAGAGVAASLQTFKVNGGQSLTWVDNSSSLNSSSGQSVGAEVDALVVSYTHAVSTKNDPVFGVPPGTNTIQIGNKRLTKKADGIPQTGSYGAINVVGSQTFIWGIDLIP